MVLTKDAIAVTGDKRASMASPLTPEEISDRLVPDEPQISPDGRNVAFTVAPVGRKGEHAERAIWLSRDSRPAERFTAGVGEDEAPRWSPDGRTIAFLSDRAERGTKRLYQIAVDGGEARLLGDLSGDLRDPTWSPDGRAIALLRDDPEAPDDKKRREDRDDAVVVDADPRRRRLWLVDVETGKARQLTHGTRQVWTFAWTPDGARLAIATTDEPGYDASCGAGDLWTLPAAGGLPRRLATFPVLPDEVLFVESSDGPALAVRANWHRDDPVDAVWLVPEAGGTPRKVDIGGDGNVDLLVAIPNDRRRVAVRVAEHARTNAYALDLDSGALAPLLPPHLHGEGAVTAGPSLSAGGDQIAVVWSGGDRPHEVYAGPVAAPAVLTRFGAGFHGRLSPVQLVTWQSDGWEIEGLLTLPVGHEAGTRHPLIVEVHGGPTGQWEDACFLDWHDWAQYLASHGFAVLAPNPRGSTGRGADFLKALQDDVGGGESRDLVAGAQAMVGRGIADLERLGIAGWSWGGYLTATTITRTNIFKAALMGAGLSNLLSDHGTGDIPNANLRYFPGWPYHDPEPYRAGSAITNIAACTTPTLIVHGDADARVHVAQGMEMYRALKTLGVPVEFVRYPREEHLFAERHHQIDLMRRLLAWFERWLKV